MRYNSTTGIYSCQLDEQWFNLHKDILRDVLQITPINDNNPFVAPPSSDAVIEYVNTLGYPYTLRNVYAMSINDLYQPWRAILFMINMCLTGKTAEHDSQDILCFRFFGDGKEIFGMPIPNAVIGAPYYDGYLAHVAEYQRNLDGEHGMVDKEAVLESPKATKVTKPKAAMQTKPSAPKATKDTKLVELSLKDLEARNQGPTRTMVIREPDSGRIQSLLEVQGKGKVKLIDEQKRTPETAEPTGPSSQPKDEGITMTNSGTESVEIVLLLTIRKMHPTGRSMRSMLEFKMKARLDQTLVNKMKARMDQTLFFVEKPQEEKPNKTNAKLEVQSMVTVPIHQDTSSVHLMTTLVIDLTTSQSESPTSHASLPTSTEKSITITATTTLPPPPPQLQQSTIDLTLL
nr:hypothetical protein [Tanacetum cinerariifolium]